MEQPPPTQGTDSQGDLRGKHTPLCPKAKWISARSALGASLGGSLSSATHPGLGPAWPVSHPEEMGAPPSCAAQTQAELITCSAAFHATVDADCSLCLTHRAGGCRHLPARRGAVRAGLPPLPPGPGAQDLGEGRGEDHTPRDLRHLSGSARGSRTVDTCCLFSGERGGEINVESYGVSVSQNKTVENKTETKAPRLCSPAPAGLDPAGVLGTVRSESPGPPRREPQG